MQDFLSFKNGPFSRKAINIMLCDSKRSSFITQNFLNSSLTRRPWSFRASEWQARGCKQRFKSDLLRNFLYLVAFILLSSHYTVLSTQHQQYPRCPSWLFILERYFEVQILWSQTVRQRKTKRPRIKVGKSSARVPGTRAQQKNATREIRATKKY